MCGMRQWNKKMRERESKARPSTINRLMTIDIQHIEVKIYTRTHTYKGNVEHIEKEKRKDSFV